MNIFKMQLCSIDRASSLHIAHKCFMINFNQIILYVLTQWLHQLHDYFVFPIVGHVSCENSSNFMQSTSSTTIVQLSIETAVVSTSHCNFTLQLHIALFFSSPTIIEPLTWQSLFRQLPCGSHHYQIFSDFIRLLYQEFYISIQFWCNNLVVNNLTNTRFFAQFLT